MLKNLKRKLLLRHFFKLYDNLKSKTFIKNEKRCKTNLMEKMKKLFMKKENNFEENVTVEMVQKKNKTTI